MSKKLKGEMINFGKIVWIQSINDEDGEIIVQGLTVNNAQKTDFILKEKDLSSISFDMIKAVLPILEPHFVDVKTLIYRFPAAIILCIRSLKIDNLSIEEFDTYWKACRQFRMAEIKTMDSTASILDKWPFYKTASGFRLIDMDFDALYTIGDGLLSKWENKRVHILQFLTSENNVRGVLDYTQKHEVDERDYLKAISKARIAESTSDINTEPDDVKTKRKRILHLCVYFTSNCCCGFLVNYSLCLSRNMPPKKDDVSSSVALTTEQFCELLLSIQQPSRTTDSTPTPKEQNVEKYSSILFNKRTNRCCSKQKQINI
ncbi:hypothetical protein RN001_002111 [Aquatica leii]|uniref:Uncharacterized protein n=1 Tax=Aquatica leii TaxID=1421715 RepID=A0AAN7SSS2_9COLE|nr:hypothetical protein RN001_002111 [Aquatica leii]